MLISCGKSDNDSITIQKEKVSVDSEFNDYIDIIKKNLSLYNVTPDKINMIDNVSIEFGHLKPNLHREPVAGVCKIKYSGRKVFSQKITIDLKLWRTFNHKYKIEIIAHELGHCAWGLKHLNASGELMSPVLLHNISEAQWQTFAFHIMKSQDNFISF